MVNMMAVIFLLLLYRAAEHKLDELHLQLKQKDTESLRATEELSTKVRCGVSGDVPLEF